MDFHRIPLLPFSWCSHRKTLTYVRSPITSQHHAEPTFSETAYWNRISTNDNTHRDSRDIQVSRCPPHHPMVYKKQAWMTWIISTQSWPWGRTLTVSIDLSGSLYCGVKFTWDNINCHVSAHARLHQQYQHAHPTIILQDAPWKTHTKFITLLSFRRLVANTYTSQPLTPKAKEMIHTQDIVVYSLHTTKYAHTVNSKL